MLPNKWHRACIGAAGIYVEVVLASICTFLWWGSEPGLFHNLCLNVMFVCSTSTIVFNANPLLRYDGYYVLADLVEIPNLRQKATTILSRKLGEWCLGLEPPDDPFLPQRNQVFFALYSIAAAAYRWVVAFSICWFLYKLFQSYDLEIVGQCVVMASLWGLLFQPLWQVAKFFYVPGRLQQVKKPRFYASLSVVVALLLAALLVPLPHSVVCPLEIQARDADAAGKVLSQPVYIEVTGKVLSLDVTPGQQVAAGQQLAQLYSTDVDLKIAELKGKGDAYRVQLESLRQQAGRDRRAAEQIPQIQEALKTVADQLEEKNRDKQRLRLSAPIAGTVMPPTITTRHEDGEETLPVWSGTPLDPENLGATLDEREKFCQIGDPKQLEAVMVVDQADRNIIREGQAVDIKLEGFPSTTLHSQIAEVAEEGLKVSPQRLSSKSGGELATKTDPQTGAEKPMSTSYQARAPIDDPEELFRLGIRGQARIYTDWLPLGTRLWRLVSHTFNFKL